MVGAWGPSRGSDRNVYCQDGNLTATRSLGEGLEQGRTGPARSWNSRHSEHIGMGERALLELSWQAWHCANFTQPADEHMIPLRQSSKLASVQWSWRGVKAGQPPFPLQGARQWLLWCDLFLVLSKSWETLSHSLNVWDLS
jgi:hypothetical protein